MKQSEAMDMKAVTSGYKIFGEIDKEVKKIEDFISDKGISISSVNDIERIEVKFNEVVKNLIKICDAAEFEIQLKEVIKARVLIDMHVGFAEKYKLDVYEVIDKLGSWNKKIFEEAMIKIKVLS